MKNVNYRVEAFSPFDIQGTEEHLSAMAARGWRLESIGRYLWKYRRAGPAQVRYAVTCPPAAGENGDLGDRLYFEELCADAGWGKVTDWAELQVYASEAQAPTPLETDEALRLEVIHQSMRRTYLRDRRNGIFCYVSLLLLLTGQMLAHPAYFFLSNAALFALLFCVLFLLGELLGIAAYVRWHRRSLLSVEAGGSLAAVPRSYRTLSRLSVVLLALLIASMIPVELLGHREGTPLFVLTLAVHLLLAALVYGLLLVLRRQNWAWQARAAAVMRNWDWQTRAAALILFFLALMAVLSGLLSIPAVSDLLRPSSPRPPSYTWNGDSWDLEPQALPLTVENLTGKSWPHTRRTVSSQGRTLFASGTDYCETAAQEDGTEAELRYVVLDVPSDPLRRAVLNDMLDGPSYLEYRSEDPGPWGAEAAYQLEYPDGEAAGEWLLCWPGRIVALWTGGVSLSQRSMSAVCLYLGPDAKEGTP